MFSKLESYDKCHQKSTDSDEGENLKSMRARLYSGTSSSEVSGSLGEGEAFMTRME
jgi:hypothetical protein